MKKELMEAIENGTLYGFISCEGWTMSKEDLCILGKELYYASVSVTNSYGGASLFKNELKENLIICYNESEEI